MLRIRGVRLRGHPDLRVNACMTCAGVMPVQLPLNLGGTKGGHETNIAADRIPDLMLKLAQLHWEFKKMEALDRLFDGKTVPAAEDVIIESKRSGIPAGELFDSLIARVRP